MRGNYNMLKREIHPMFIGSPTPSLFINGETNKAIGYTESRNKRLNELYGSREVVRYVVLEPENIEITPKIDLAENIYEEYRIQLRRKYVLSVLVLPFLTGVFLLALGDLYRFITANMFYIHPLLAFSLLIGSLFLLVVALMSAYKIPQFDFIARKRLDGLVK